MKVKELDLVRACKDCGEMYATDQPFKVQCYPCWLKENKPEEYANRFELHEITCEICGEIFVDEPWKNICYGCWLRATNESKLQDLEEREEYDK